MFNVLIISFWISAGLLVYTQIGYLILLRVLAAMTWRRTSDIPADEELPNVTLIIPAYNEETVLRTKLENSLQIDYPDAKLEVIVASDGSSDRTIEIASGFEEQGVRTLAFTSRRGKASVLNDAVAAARGDVLCLCDANVMFRPDALKIMVAGLDDPQVGAVSGDVQLASDESNFGVGESAYYRLERTIQIDESRLGSMMGVDGGMYVIPRDLFQPLPPDTILDDFVVSMRVIQQGRRIRYEATAIASENGTPRASQEFGRRVRVSAGAMQALLRGHWPPFRRPVELFQFLSHKLLRWMGPVWLVMLLAASMLLWNSAVVYRIAAITQVGFYLIAAMSSVSLRLRETRLGGMTFYFTMSHVAMAVGLVKGLLNQQRVTWNRTERGERSPQIRRTEATASATTLGTRHR